MSDPTQTDTVELRPAGAHANPFIGTEAFRTGDRLFGRDREIVELTNRILARRVVALHSPSGAGKTSLVQAGLIPVMNKRGLHILPKVRLNNTPPEGKLPAGTETNRYVFSALMSLDAGQGLRDDEHITYEEMARLSLAQDGLAQYLKKHSPHAEHTTPKRPKNGPPPRRLLFFDQFEEILTLDPTDGPVKKDFFIRLSVALADPHLLVILALREEYVAGLEPYLIYLPDRLSARFRLELLGHSEAVEAIRKPSQGAKVSFQKKAAEQLVHELSLVTVREGSQVKKIPGPYVEPVQLQVVARDLFERRHDPHTITAADVEQLGSVENALGAYYEKKLKQIAAGDEDLERRLRDWIESELIIAGSLRGLAAAGEEAKAGLVQADIEKLIAAYLVREEPRRNVVWYELAHDSLVRPIVAGNATWRELHASEFERQAARWNLAAPAERERLLPPADALRQAVAWGEAQARQLTPEQAAYLSAARKELQRLETRHDDRAELGLNLEDTGWGVIFAADAPAALREALTELLDHRREAATRRRPTYYREFFGANGYRAGETAQRFLARFDAGSGPANPEKVPFYLLIVGGPQEIPFEFQYALDAQYAVGRIEFDTLEEYARYARSVVVSETERMAGNFTLPNRMAVFATRHPDDRATDLAMEYLVLPVVEAVEAGAPNWQIDRMLEAGATKANLAQALGGAPTPALLFTVTHTIADRSDYPDQLRTQGALVCQDWPGAQRWRQPMSPEFIFTGEDVPADGNLLGTIVLAFGDFAAGTPQFDNFPHSSNVRQIADQPFLARLPRRLLSHPNGGALAVIAHVDRAWTTSFTGETGEAGGTRLTSDTGAFVKVLTRLIQGSTAGIAMEDMNRRYSYFSSLLADELIAVNFFNHERDEKKLLKMMYQTIDARNYILIGDPAVRLPVSPEAAYAEPEPGWKRPVIGAVQAPAVPTPVEPQAEAPGDADLEPVLEGVLEPVVGPLAGGAGEIPVEDIDASLAWLERLSAREEATGGSEAGSGSESGGAGGSPRRGLPAPELAGEEPATTGAEPAELGDEPQAAGAGGPSTGEEPATAGEEPGELGEGPQAAGAEPPAAGEVSEAGVARIQIQSGDHPPGEMEFRPPVMAVGRGAGNDLVLDDRHASRQHARLEYSAGRFQVIDLQSANGTFLNEVRLLPHVPEVWAEGAVLRIGNTTLRLTPRQAAVLRTAMAAAGGEPAAEAGKMSLTLERAELAVAAGQSLTFQAVVTNQGATVEHYQVTLSGLPAEWVAIAGERGTLMPGNQAAVAITLQPPASAAAGRYPFALKVAPLSDPARAAAAQATLLVGAPPPPTGEAAPAISVDNIAQAILKGQKPNLSKFKSSRY